MKTYYFQDIKNTSTSETLRIKAPDKYTLEQKVNKKLAAWKTQQVRMDAKNQLDSNQEASLQNTKNALKEIDDYNKVLEYTLNVNDRINWDNLVDNSSFNISKPVIENYSRKSNKDDLLKKLPFFGSMFKENIKNEELKLENEFKKQAFEWTAKKVEFEKNKNDRNHQISTQKFNYESNIDEGVINYFYLVLERSKYPNSLNLNYEVYYEENSKLLIIDIDLPNKNEVPKIIEYKYSSTKKEFLLKEMKEKELESFYNNLVYKILLRTIHEIFESDYKEYIDIIVINAWVEGVDSKTGKDFRNCIASLQVTKKEFVEINLDKIDPKDCFKHLKGVSAGSLINLSPVRPIMVLNKNDNRIIKASNIIDNFDSNSNLAVMPWEDFEVLVRDLFAKEFSSESCTVEVTRASRDAGVDAIAFDEDPVKGGKFVIQAKRYNNLVPVSAVRDLYGTVMNEGAVKGILVTTSYFGPDSLEFVKNKPLTLINGEQLLYLFNKHNYNFKIEIQKKQKSASYNSY